MCFVYVKTHTQALLCHLKLMLELILTRLYVHLYAPNNMYITNHVDTGTCKPMTQSHFHITIWMDCMSAHCESLNATRWRMAREKRDTQTSKIESNRGKRELNLPQMPNISQTKK